MDTPTCLRHLEAEGRAFGAVLADADPEAPVPACPGWTLAKLAKHLTIIHTSVEVTVRTRAAERIDRKTLPLPESYGEGLDRLLATLHEAPDDAPVWNWSTTRPRTAAFWPRRMAQETALHRWDAEHAAGRPSPVDAALAADGLHELFTVWLPTFAPGLPASLPGSVHLHATDAEAEWFVAPAPGGGVDVRNEHAKGDAAVRAGASDLLLWAWNRPVAEGAVEVLGDRSVAAAWRETFRF